MKHFKQEGMQKLLNTILLLCPSMLSPAPLQRYVLAIVLQLTKLWDRLLMQLRIAAWQLLWMGAI